MQNIKSNLVSSLSFRHGRTDTQVDYRDYGRVRETCPAQASGGPNTEREK